ncbi:MAG: shikimate kinase [bacterium]|nr:shikimate kinase [bacterium]MBU1917693.1 shikimate kinase [bacterium]
MALHTGKNIYITGFMATGKSTVGRLLAKKLQRKFIDTDRHIEYLEQASIKDIFSKHGEDYFRKKEATCILETCQHTNLVVSLGGGAVLSEQNRLVFQKGVWIYLDTPMDTIQERLNRTSHRPLAQKNPELIQNLFAQRQHLYQMANLIIDCAHKNSDEICQALLKRMMHESA